MIASLTIDVWLMTSYAPTGHSYVAWHRPRGCKHCVGRIGGSTPRRDLRCFRARLRAQTERVGAYTFASSKMSSVLVWLALSLVCATHSGSGRRRSVVSVRGHRRATHQRTLSVRDARVLRKAVQSERTYLAQWLKHTHNAKIANVERLCIPPSPILVPGASL